MTVMNKDFEKLTLPSLLEHAAVTCPDKEAIIIDDIGYIQQTRDEMEALFTFLAERYETGSVMITSNLTFSKWEHIFKDPILATAAIDRLVHHCTIVELNLPSFRMQHAKKKGGAEKNTEKIKK